jgi:PEGA domain
MAAKTFAAVPEAHAAATVPRAVASGSAGASPCSTSDRPFCTKVRTKRAVARAKSEDGRGKSAVCRTFTPAVLAFYFIVLTFSAAVLAKSENDEVKSENDAGQSADVLTFTPNFPAFSENGRTSSENIAAASPALPTISDVYASRGFSYSEAEAATAQGWRQLRLKQIEPTASLSPTDLIAYVSGFGKLIIRSTPNGANVELDGQPLTVKTEAVTWPSAGTYRVKLSLDGYQSVEDTCVIEEGRPALFERKMTPIKKAQAVARPHGGRKKGPHKKN